MGCFDLLCGSDKGVVDNTVPISPQNHIYPWPAFPSNSPYPGSQRIGLPKGVSMGNPAPGRHSVGSGRHTGEGPSRGGPESVFTLGSNPSGMKSAMPGYGNHHVNRHQGAGRDSGSGHGGNSPSDGDRKSKAGNRATSNTRPRDAVRSVRSSGGHQSRDGKPFNNRGGPPRARDNNAHMHRGRSSGGSRSGSRSQSGSGTASANQMGATVRGEFPADLSMGGGHGNVRGPMWDGS